MRIFKRTVNCAVVTLLLLVMVFTAVACSQEQLSAEEMAEIWSVPNTEKILQDRDYSSLADKGAGALTYETAKGEYESAQLIVTAKANIGDIELVAGELTGPNGDKITTDEMDVYFQKYMEINAMSSPQAPADFGWWPDALVPMSAIKEYNENSVEAGKNQGFTVTIFTPTDAETGTYSGNFTLKMDGEEVKIPVSIDVWDFVVPQETHMKTSIYLNKTYMMGGELDNTDAMYQEYYDFLLDYRLAIADMPVFDNSIETYVEQAKKYAADPRCGAYNMLFKYESKQVVYEDIINKFISEIDYEYLIDTLKALAEASTKEVNLFTKLYMYDIAVDEPEGTNRIEDANYKQIMINQSLQTAVDELKSEGFDFAAHGLTEDDILGVEFVITGRWISQMPDIRTYCPLVSDFTTEEQRDFYAQLREEEYKTTWWYDAWQPQYPYPNYRIEESSVGSRVMSWMQKDYGITGMLYWGAAVYNEVTMPDAVPGPRDPYTNPYSFGGAKVTQDGMLTYPGRPYGIYGPVPSIRLESIRDGIEDYEYLWLLEQLVGEAAEEYGADFTFDGIMRSIYDNLYSGVIPSTDGSRVLDARCEVAEMIELLQNPAKAVILVEDVDAVSNTAKIEVFAAAGTTIKIDGEDVQSEVSKDGLKFTYTKALSESDNFAIVEFTNGTYTHTFEKYVGKRGYAVPLFDGQNNSQFEASRGSELDPKDHITLEKNPDAIDGYDGNAMKVSIAKYETDNVIASTIYLPRLTISKAKSFADISASEIDTIYLSIYNASDTDKTLQVYLGSGTSEKMFLEFTLKPGHNSVRVSQVYLDSWSVLAGADRISLVFEQCKADTPDVYYIRNVYYTVK